MIKLSNKVKDIVIGVNKYGQKLTLTKPVYEKDLRPPYWAFGYLDNKDMHTHLSSIREDYRESDRIVIDDINNYFTEFVITDEKDMWKFCEIVSCIYSLKKMAEIFKLGSARISVHKDVEKILKRDEYYEDINNNIIPSLINILYELLDKYVK